jgi:hypothetical protein
MSIVNTCYTNELQEMENAEKINEEEMDKLLKQINKLKIRRATINKKFSILRPLQLQECINIKYLPMFAKECNEIIRNSIKQDNYIRIRNFILEFSHIRLEAQFYNEICNIIKLFVSSIKSFSKNRKPILNGYRLNELMKFTDLHTEISKLNTNEEKKQYFYDTIILRNMFYSYNNYFNSRTIQTILNLQNHTYTFNIEEYILSLFSILIEIDYDFINTLLLRLQYLSQTLHILLTKIENNWIEGVENYYDIQKTSQYKLLNKYDNNSVMLTEFLNKNYINQEVYNKLKNNKPITLCNKIGAMNKKINREIVYWDLVLYLYNKTNYEYDLNYFYINDLPFMPSNAIDNNMRLFNFIKTDCNWFIKNVLVDFQLFNLEHFVETNRNYYTTRIYDRDKLDNDNDYDSEEDFDCKNCRYVYGLDTLKRFAKYKIRETDNNELTQIRNGFCKIDMENYDFEEGSMLNWILNCEPSRYPF